MKKSPDFHIEAPIFITGAARSGTSMTAGIVHHCGAFGGKLAGPTGNNKRGMFENSHIRNHIVKPHLKSIGCDPMGQDPLPVTANIQPVPALLASKWRREIIRVMRSQGYKKGPWFYKGAKMCLLWPVWHAAFPEAKWVIVRRDAEDIVKSCLRTNFMRAFRKRSGWLGWVAEHEKRFEEMHDAGLNVQEVWPQRMIAGDFSQMQMVINNLDLKWDLDAVREFVDPGLWRRWKSRLESRTDYQGDLEVADVK